MQIAIMRIMKLNSMPKNKCSKKISCTKESIRSNSISVIFISLLPLVSSLVGSNIVSCQSHHAPETQPPERNLSSARTNRDVTNLQLKSDFRSVRLSWNYESHGDKDIPASFDVRYCELTSWNIEIKCRHRDSQVTVAGNDLMSELNQNITTRTTSDLVRHLNSSDGPNYEAQIYDLRALTNYTFQVQVSRFEHEKLATTTTTVAPASAGAARRQRTQAAARRLAASDESNLSHLVGSRIETKPFGAEATKCLADVSEVLINTGRFFGGRISVEDSTDPRCNMLGNKSSEQSSYLFRIDHHICDSKLVDGNRIETMVLVHENKDILTHNTARFLVLCNFLQTKSFTLRASVSLPKVNGLLPATGTRPAVITSLPSRPGGGPLQAAHDGQLPAAGTSLVMLGSMPGIYRARGDGQFNDSNLEQPAVSLGGVYVTATPSNQLDGELEANTIEKKLVERKKESRAVPVGGYEMDSNVSVVSAESVPASRVRQEQSQVISTNSNDDNQVPLKRHSSSASARSLGTALDKRMTGGGDTGGSSQVHLPQPVQVQSKVLFVERGGGGFAREARQHQVVEGFFSNQDQANKGNHSPQVRSSTSGQIETTPTANYNNNGSNGNQLSTHPQQTSPMPRITSASLVTSPATTSQPPTSVADTFDEGSPLALVTRKSKKLQLAAKTGKATTAIKDEPVDSRSAPIIMTNNHRVSGDYLPVAVAAARAAAAKSAAASPNLPATAYDNYSIKYSTAKVDDFPLASDLPPLIELTSQLGRARSGRMQRLNTAAEVTADSGSHLHNLAAAPATTSHLLPPLRPVASRTTNPDLVSDFDVTDPVRSSLAPVWTVNRMGELLAEGGDLASAETSNETQSGGGSTATGIEANPSLAQNITGALLRWSLKTLGNLAKISLESLAEAHANSSLTNETNESEIESSSESGQIVARIASTTTTTTSTKRPVVMNSILQQKTNPSDRHQTQTPGKRIIDNKLASSSVAPAATVSQETTTVEPALNSSRPATTGGELPSPKKPLSSDEKDLDGFITDQRRSPSSGDQRQHTSRPSNYSKSLDLNRLTTDQSSVAQTRPKYSERNGNRLREQQSIINNPNDPTKVTKSHPNHHQHHHHHNTQHLSNYRSNESTNASSNRQHGGPAFYSSWMFYALILLVALVIGIVPALYLLDSASSSSGASVPGARIGGQINCSAVRPALGFDRDSSSAATSCQMLSPQADGSTASSESNLACHESPTSYQRYDYNKFENFPAISNGHLLLARQDPDSCSSSTGSSASGRFLKPLTARQSVSSADGTALMVDENDCKNNEFLYTEHVLINTSSKFGSESYA